MICRDFFQGFGRLLFIFPRDSTSQVLDDAFADELQEHL